MSEIIFDGQAHTLTLIDNRGEIVGTWAANNRTASTATLRFIPDGQYTSQDSTATHRHGPAEDTLNGEYGTKGILWFKVPGHEGVGIHAGRDSDADRTPQRASGPDHVTMGCIRTTEAAMTAISQTIESDPVYNIRVRNNRNQRR